MSFKIEKNVPLPTGYKPPHRPGKYDFLADMQSGDSIFLPNSSINNVRQAWMKFVKGKPKDTRKEYDFHHIATEENNVKGVRLWLNPYTTPEDGAADGKKKD